MKKLRYGNTNTFFIKGSKAGLLIDTDYAGTLPRFFKAIKESDIDIKEISYVIATHYHPDHIGLVGELQKLGITLLILDIQIPFIHFADEIFSRERNLGFVPINEKYSKIISCEESRAFLKQLGISGEIISTSSHSLDSISIILDDGNCFVGDLEPFEYLSAYSDNTNLKNDWEKLFSYKPRKIHYAHVNEKVFDEGSVAL